MGLGRSIRRIGRSVERSVRHEIKRLPRNAAKALDLVPDMPDMPDLPEAPAPAEADDPAKRAEAEELNRMSRGRASTILTSPRGLVDDPHLARRVLLG